MPKLSDPRKFVTLDPELNFDWADDRQFPSLTVTAGRSVGKAFGGTAQVHAKPTVLFGGDPGDWSLEMGFKVLGF